ncbi:MAG TPA: hypothetical protein VII24_11925 [Pseudolabrys sp.]
MTREQRIAVALAALKPPPDKIAVCRRDIEAMLRWVQSDIEAKTQHKVFSSKKGKNSLKPYLKAQHQVRTAYDKIDPAIRPWFSIAETAYIAGQTVQEREIKRVEDLAGLILENGKIRDRRPSKPKRDAVAAKAAMRAAYHMLKRWGHKPTGSIGGKWDRLTIILANSDAKSLHDHLSEREAIARSIQFFDLERR